MKRKEVERKKALHHVKSQTSSSECCVCTCMRINARRLNVVERPKENEKKETATTLRKKYPAHSSSSNNNKTFCSVCVYVQRNSTHCVHCGVHSINNIYTNANGCNTSQLTIEKLDCEIDFGWRTVSFSQSTCVCVRPNNHEPFHTLSSAENVYREKYQFAYGKVMQTFIYSSVNHPASQPASQSVSQPTIITN